MTFPTNGHSYETELKMQIIHNVSGPDYVTVCATSYFLTVIMQKGNMVIHDRWSGNWRKWLNQEGGWVGQKSFPRVAELIATDQQDQVSLLWIDETSVCPRDETDDLQSFLNGFYGAAVNVEFPYISQLFEACFMKSLFLFRSYLFIHAHT